MKTSDKIRAILESITIVFVFFGMLLLVISWVSHDVVLNEYCATIGGVMLIVSVITGITSLTTKFGDDKDDNFADYYD